MTQPNFMMLGRFVRAEFLTFFFALVTSCATADEIDDIVTSLPDGWNDDASGTIIMPQTASTEDVLQKVCGKWWFPTNQPPTGYIQITNFTVLKTRQVAIPCCHFPGAHVYPYTAVLIQSNCGEKVVLLRCFDVYTSRAWLSSEVFDVKPGPSTLADLYDGTVELPSGFTHTQEQGIDSFVGHITSQDGKLVIHYDIGIDAGVAALQPEGQILSSTNVTANGLKAIIVIVKRGDVKQVIVSFPKVAANFFALIRNDADFELVKKISLSYRLKPE